MKIDLSTEYSLFIRDNRIKVNGYLNKVLWLFVLTGPAIASGVKGGVFPDITYATCISISAAIIIMSSIHLLLLKKYPAKTFTCVYALTSLNVLIAYMSYSHVNIYLTWFLVPLLSLLFCDKHIYYYAFFSNYILMFVTTLVSAPYRSSFRTEYVGNVVAYFRDVFGGFTIESIIMFASGYIIGTLTLDYFKSLFDQYKIINEQKSSMKEKMELLDSMAGIYDNVNLIDFVDHTERSLRDEKQEKYNIDMTTQTHTLMNQRIKNQVMPDQLEEFLKFTNIQTVRSRLTRKKLISADFIDVISGWFRAQYITVDSNADGVPNMVIYTTRNVDEEKRREEYLIRISMTDEMTRLFNRRCYDEDLIKFRDSELPQDLAIISVDVNGLKTVNDTKGHAAGDELIKGAADCLALSVGKKGKVYRTGGDEFMAVVYTGDPEELRRTITEKASSWKGIYSQELFLSVGYATHADHIGASIDKLEQIADAEMYADKEQYYREKGIDRRRQ